MEDDFLQLQKIKEGDADAFRSFFIQTYPALFGYVMSYVKNEMKAKDVTQQAFVKFWTNRHKIKLDRAPKGYLYTIAFNIFLDQKRKQKVEVEFIDHLTREAIEDEHEEKERLEEDLKRLRTVMETLPEKCKKVLIMNKIEGLKYREIADILGISIKTVESQMRIAFSKIRTAFKNETADY